MGWSRLRRIVAVALVAAGTCLAPGTAGAAPAVCEDVRVPVAVALTAHSVYGRLCVPEGATTLQVLVPGGTYNSAYWDIGYSPENLSYRQAMNRAGIATVAVDRLGSGRSSKPLSVLLGLSTQAKAVHAVIQSLRPRFERVVLVGHSIGSAVATTEAVTYRDVDGVVLTGLSHQINLPGAVPVFTTLIPTTLDPRTVGRGLDLGYLTTIAGSRYSSFHSPGVAERGALDFDEATKDVVTPLETVSTVLISELLPLSRRITVPVMVVMGGRDGNFCGPPLGADCSSSEALRLSEGRFYAPEARLNAYVVPGYGHSLNFSPNAPGYHRAVAEWTDRIG
ncbi:alpha/beta hydrolase [Saccharothrix texasensis]|uniref:Alpha-beta hydrolase superfamily lysophospholipase n=1 Tax=Saccharothrix texasensis TaxID=103734 RepID=A0A3N1HIT4_9PSEU|nr:alpha/beta fold hydrolase [Saccharothrix texasensis]ROP42212.1 alpha-beta hydrolase superfamily lysophospholipase [Saccharothrix texasensis]